MAVQFLLFALAFTACTAAPQFASEDIAQPPIPYEFGYGVNVAETGDAKEHKQTVSSTGRTDGEFRWHLGGGIYLVTRYYVDGDSGYQAEVSREPGPDVSNYYTNSLTQENSQGAASSQSFAKSLDSRRPSLGSSSNLISPPRQQLISVRPNPAPAPRPFQSFRSQSRPRPQPRPQPQPIFSQQSFSSGNIIDGGIIDGGIIDGGIIDGGIIDGGIINDSFEDNSRFSG